jgi:hypothetical protein
MLALEESVGPKALFDKLVDFLFNNLKGRCNVKRIAVATATLDFKLRQAEFKLTEPASGKIAEWVWLRPPE